MTKGKILLIVLIVIGIAGIVWAVLYFKNKPANSATATTTQSTSQGGLGYLVGDLGGLLSGLGVSKPATTTG